MSQTVDPLAAARIGGSHGILAEEEIRAFVRDQLASVDLDGRSVCVLVPDGARSIPLPLLLSEVHAALDGRVTKASVLVAVRTHGAMSEDALAAHVGSPYPGTTVLNHAW